MNIQKYYPVLALALMVGVLLLVSACNQPLPGTGSSSSSSSLTTLQVLQNSENAMKQLKSSHIELQSNSSYQVTGAKPTTSIPGAIGVAPNGNATITGSGDEALPDQEQLQLTVNQSTKMAQVVQGDNVYVQNAQGKWYVLNKSDFTGLVANPFAGVNFDENSLLGLIEHANISDHGEENLNGQSLRHISAALDKTALRQLLSDNPQLVGTLGKQNVDELLNDTKSFQSTIDVWIDEGQFYVHRAQLKLNLTANTSVVTSGQSTTTSNLNTTVDLSKFNAPVTITPPSNAIPTHDPAVVFANS